MSVTQAMRFLKDNKVPFEVAEYDYRVKGAEAAAKALNWPLEAMFKTLVVALDDKRFVLCIMPGTAELSLKNLARVAGAKTARMATEAEAEKLTGYLVGGISPFGTKKRVEVFAHASFTTFPKIGINGGRRGLMALLDPNDAVRALGISVQDLST